MIQSEGAPPHGQLTDTRWPSKQLAAETDRPADNDGINCRKFVYDLIVSRKAATGEINITSSTIRRVTIYWAL